MAMNKTKVVIKRGKFQRFAGLNFVAEDKTYQELLDRVDNKLGARSKSGAGYRYSEVLNALVMTTLAGGSSIEDVGKMQEELEVMKDGKSPSPDTILRTLSRLSVENELVTAKKSGNKYNFNRNHLLNSILLEGTQQLGLLPECGEVDFDYDNQIIATNKYDAVKTYKEVFGYAPGIAFANGHPIYIEGRQGNAPVTFDQAETLRNSFELLESHGLKVRDARMDAGSYTKDCVEVVEKYATHFYIRAINSDDIRSIATTSRGGWKRFNMRSSKGLIRKLSARSIHNEEFIEGKTYRVVIYREEDKKMRGGLFAEDEAVKYRYFAIITNDFDSEEEVIIKKYNGRGAIERVFDQMNNDFNWKWLPSSEMSVNTTFMILTALIRAIYSSFLRNLAQATGGLIKAVSRLKAFIFQFVTCGAEWLDNHTLQLYGPPLLLEVYVRKRE